MSINKKVSRKTSSKNKRSINRKTKRQVKRRGGLKKKTMDEALKNTKFCYPTWYIKSKDGEYKQGNLSVPPDPTIAIKKKELLEQLQKNGFENVNKDDIKLLPHLKPIEFNGELFNGNNMDQLAYLPKKITLGDKSQRVCYNKNLSLDDWNKLYPKKEEGQDIKKIDHVSQPQQPEKSSFVPATNIKELNSEINDKENKENNDKKNNDNNDIGEIQSFDDDEDDDEEEQPEEEIIPFDDSGSSSDTASSDEEHQGGRRKKTKRRKSKKTRRKSRKTRRKPRVLRRMKRRI